MIANNMTHEHVSAMDMKPKTSKHMMERKRRARINDSLLQLKSLVFPAIRKEISRQPKMEKADILEMTVRYLKAVQTPSDHQQNDGRNSPVGSAGQISQYHAGFSECLGEASTFLAKCESVDLETRLRIMNHLADRCSNLADPCEVSPQQRQQRQNNNYVHSNTSTVSRRQTASPSPVPMATTAANTRVPPMTYVSHPQQQLMLCIPSDYSSMVQTNPSLLSNQSSIQSSVLFPTPPPSPIEAAQQQQYTRVASPKTQYKAKSTIATSYRCHSAVINAPSQENLWRPW